MERVRRTVQRAAAVVAVLLLCRAALLPASAGSMRQTGPPPVSGGDRSVLLSLKISAAEKRDRKVAFYKSVARQRKTRGATGGRSSPSGR